MFPFRSNSIYYVGDRYRWLRIGQILLLVQSSATIMKTVVGAIIHNMAPLYRGGSEEGVIVNYTSASKVTDFIILLPFYRRGN